MTTTRTKTLSDGTRLNVTVHNEQKYHRKHKHQFAYPPQVVPGDKGAKCERCGLVRTNKIHSGVGASASAQRASDSQRETYKGTRPRGQNQL